MIVAVGGASGFIGSSLLKSFRQKEYTIRTIDRHSFSLADAEFSSRFIDGADVVINLSGAPVAKKWTPAYKHEILSSRISTTRKIADAISLAANKPELFINGSAIGIYDSVNTHDETSTAYAGNFLSKVCLEWESEAFRVGNPTRVAVFRTGVVLGKDGGALVKMQLPFSIGLGGKIGSGKQYVSFIHIHDLVSAFNFVIEHKELSGVINAVSPYPCDNAEFTDKLGKVFGQPAWFTVPGFILKMVFGEGALVLLEGQKVLPGKLLQADFKFRFPSIQNALVDIFS